MPDDHGYGYMMMFFGLGFFLLIAFALMWWQIRDDDRKEREALNADRQERERYERRMHELVIFGIKKHDPPTDEKATSKK